MPDTEQVPPPQPADLTKVQLHRKTTRGHPLEEEIARALAHEMGRCVVAMEGMTVTLHKPLGGPAEQVLLARRFLELTSTPHGWWQQALDSGLPARPAKDIWSFWVRKAEVWLAQRGEAGHPRSKGS